MTRPLTLVLGASPLPDRYSYMAVQRLLAHGHPVIAVGRREGQVEGIPIRKEVPAGVPIDTVTLYLGPLAQQPWMDELLELMPRRIIFNPGTEHPELEHRAHQAGIEVVRGCTLVMLAARTY